MAIWAIPQSIPFPREIDPWQPDHGKLFLYRRRFQTVGQGYRLWQPYRALPEPDPAATPAPNHDSLRFYRPTYQTVGQGYRLWTPYSAPQAGEFAALPQLNHDQLRFYRPTYQTVGQGYRLWQPYPPPRVEEEIPGAGAQVALFSLRGQPGVVRPQPFWAFVREPTRVEAEQFTVTVDAQLLFKLLHIPITRPAPAAERIVLVYDNPRILAQAGPLPIILVYDAQRIMVDPGAVRTAITYDNPRIIPGS